MSTKYHSGDVLDTVGYYQIIQCTECCYTHAHPLPTEAFLKRFYAEEFFTKAKPDYVQRYEEDRAWWETHHTFTLQQAAGFLRKNGDVLSVLDVGAGPGIFLDVAKQMRWSTYGIEPSLELCEALSGRGHNMVCGVLEDIELATTSDKFDFIHLYEVLEHVPDPAEFLAHCHRLLNQSGVLCVVVPSDYNVLQLEACRRFGLPHYWVAPPQHLNYFNPNDLANLVMNAGFAILECRGTFPMEQFIIDGHNYVGNDVLGRECHHARVKYELDVAKAGTWPALMQTYRNNLAQSGAGREIVLMARKLF